jgi:transmembrane sensor
VRLNSGTTGEAELQAFEDWRAISADHETAAIEAEALWGNLSELHFDKSAGLVRPGRRSATSRPEVSRRAVLTSLLCLGATATLGSTFWSSGMARRLTADYSSATAEPRSYDLPDGSRMHLNARSAADLHFSDTLRRVTLLEGQAFFEVAPDITRPFEVLSGGVSVIALGTAFDVSCALPNGMVEVAVTQHRVRVASQGASISVDVGEGQSVAIDGSGRIGSIAAKDVAVTTAWKDGLYIAESRSLEEVVNALSAWHRGMILISSEKLKKLEVSAVLDLRQPDVSLDALQNGLPLRVRHISSFLTVISET